MTFTEAAVEVLRRAGRPLHFSDIAQQAVQAGLLSHVGQTPEQTMGARLFSVASRGYGRSVLAVEQGTYGLPEWGIPGNLVDPEPPADPQDDGSAAELLRPRERHPSLIPEVPATGGGRREERRREEGESGDRAGSGSGSRSGRKYPRPAEAAHEWLRQRGEPASLAELAAALRSSDKISEALERDSKSFERALREDNRRRTDAGRAPLFEIDGDLVRALDPNRRIDRPDRAEPRGKARAESVWKPPAAFEEQKRNVLRVIRRRVGGLELDQLERVVAALLLAQGLTGVSVVRRSRDTVWMLARKRWGVTDLRCVVRVCKPGRDLTRVDVTDVRRDSVQYSAHMAILVGTADCARDARVESNGAGETPVIMFGLESLAEALFDASLGVTRRTVEWPELDEGFFSSVGSVPFEAYTPAPTVGESDAGADGSPPRAQTPATADSVEPDPDERSASAGAKSAAPSGPDDGGSAAEAEGRRRRRGRDRRRRRDRTGDAGDGSGGASENGSGEVPAADGAAG